MNLENYFFFIYNKMITWYKEPNPLIKKKNLIMTPITWYKEPNIFSLYIIKFFLEFSQHSETGS